MGEPTGCATRLQQASYVTLMTATSRFIILVSLLAASWSWFQDRKMTNRQRQVQSQFTGKCISLRNPWGETFQEKVVLFTSPVWCSACPSSIGIKVREELAREEKRDAYFPRGRSGDIDQC